MLSFFDGDIQEAALRNPQWFGVLGNAVGVHTNFLNTDLSFTQYFGINNGIFTFLASEEPVRPAVVHLLHFTKKEEIESHRTLSGRFNGQKIKMVNPYNSGTSNCDSKFRMYRVLRDSGFPTPETRLISRFTRNKTDSLKEIERELSGTAGTAGSTGSAGTELYLQPDRGTEGEDCFFLEYGEWENTAALIDWGNRDFVVRRRAGDTLYKGDNLVFRINVCHDGEAFRADSGYCMTGGRVVSAEAGARRININDVIAYLNLADEAVNTIRQACCEAVKAVFKKSKCPLLVGVDAVLEKQGAYFPLVIDINVRPVVVGSRTIGENRVGLGERFWKGVTRLC